MKAEIQAATQEAVDAAARVTLAVTGAVDSLGKLKALTDAIPDDTPPPSTGGTGAGTGGGTTTPPPPPPATGGTSAGSSNLPKPPVINVAPPVLNNPETITGSTQELSQSGKSYTFTNRKMVPNASGAVARKLLYKTKGGTGTHIPLIDISHHDLVGASGIIRVQEEEVDELRIAFCRLLQGGYAPGVIAGLLHVGHGKVHKIRMSDCEYDRAQPVTSPGDIYAGLCTGGGHNDAGFTYGWCEDMEFVRCAISNYWTNYTGTDAGKYPNSDAAVFEKFFKNGRFFECLFRHGADAGLDRKSPNTTMDQCILFDNRENDKLWCPAEDGIIFSDTPRKAHVVVTPQPEYGRIPYHCKHRQFKGKNPAIPLFDIQRQGWNAVYDSVDLEQLPAGQLLYIAEKSAYGSTIKFGDKTYTVDKAKALL